MSNVDDEQALVNTAGPLGGLPEPVDAADRIDGLPAGEELPVGVGSVDVDGSWSSVPGIPVSVREDADADSSAPVDEVEVSVSAPESNETAVGDAPDSVLVALTPAPTEATTTETPAPVEPTQSPTDVAPPSDPSSPAETPSASETTAPEEAESPATAATEAPGAATPTETAATEIPAVSETPETETPETETPAGTTPTETPSATPTETPATVTDAVPEPEQSAVPEVEVRVDYSDFAQAFGGGWSDRLSVSAYPACYAETPELAECAQGVAVESVNDEAGEVVKFSTTDVELAALATGERASAAFAGGAAVFAVTAEAGNYAATPVPASSSWQVGTGSGEFSYAYPFDLPSVMGVAAPSLGLSYSSGSVDGMTSAENGQASQAGLGWDMSTGYITRSFASCKDDGHDNKGDWCWKSRTGVISGGVPQLVEDYRIVLAGQSSRMIRIGTSNQFRLAQDPGWRIRLLAGDGTGMDNDDNNDEGFVVESPDGTSYFFGSGNGTNSVWTVPVFGNDVGEPCHKAAAAESWCQQAWRWNLDKSVDSLGHKVVYTYKTEDNFYALWDDENNPVRYDRAGYLDEIFYGLKENQDRGDAHARLTVYSGPRCNVELDGVGDCLANGNTPRQAPELWPDVPTDLICDRHGTCNSSSPSFFSIHRYARVVTQTLGDEGQRHSVDQYDLSFTMPDPDKTPSTDGPDEPDLWLNAIRRTGLGGNIAEIQLPAVRFDGVVLRNKVVAPSGARRLAKFRIDSLRNETGGRVQVRYGHADGRACDADYVAGRDRWDSDRECFAQRWAPPGADLGPDEDPPWTWFHKYVVTRVALGDDAVGYRLGGEDQVVGGGASVLGGLRVYDYEYAGAPGWRFENSPLRATRDESWTDWRGYERTWLHTRRTGDHETIQPGDVSLQRVIRFRGLSGNLAKPGGQQTQTALAVADNPTDHGWLQGRTAETVTYQPVDGQPDPDRISRNYTTYDWLTTVDPADDKQAKARLIWADSSTSITYPRNGGTSQLVTKVTTAVDDGGATHRGVRAGAVTQVQTRATESKATTCATTTWAAAAGDEWIRAPHDQVTRAATEDVAGDFGACGGASTAQARSITYYDNQSGAGIVAGLPTKVVAYTGPDGDPVNGTVSTSMTYDSWGRLTSSTDPRGAVSQVDYVPDNGLTTQVIAENAKGHLTTTNLDVWRGQPVETTDANNASTRMAYDALGRLVTVRKPGNTAGETPTAEFAYNVNAKEPSRVKTTLQRSGEVTDAAFAFTDGWGRTITTLTPSTGSDRETDRWVAAITGYDEQGQTRFTVPSALTAKLEAVNIVLDENAPRYTRASYDAAGRALSASDMYDGEAIATTRWTHRGNSTVTNPPVGGDTVTTIDALGRTLGVNQHASSATSTILSAAAYTYTPSGALATIKAAHQAGAAESTWSNTYDWLGQRQSATDPDTGTSTYDYDPSGNLTKTQSAGVTTATEYDVLNRPLTRLDKDGKVRASWTYDTAPAGATVGASTNLVGRPVTTTSHTAEGALVTTAAGYEGDGDLKGSTATWPAPWATTGATPGQTASAKVSYDYNDASQVTKTSYSAIYNAGNLGLPARDITSKYTTGGLWSKDTTDGGNTVIAKADYNWRNQPIGLDSSTATPTGQHELQRAYTWQDATGYLDTLAATTGTGTSSQTWLSLGYAYDAGGNILAIDGRAYEPATATTAATTVTGAWCYTYDGLNRLATAKTGELSSATTCDTNAGSTSMVGNKHNLAYSYTRDGLATYTDVDSGATASYAYPDAGDPSKGQPVHGVTAISQTGNDSKKVMPLSGDGTIAMAYDTAGRITNLTKTDANQTSNPVGTWYSYDTQGNLASQTTGRTLESDTREVTDALYDADGMRVLRRTTTHKNKNATTTSTFYLGDTEITLTGGKHPARTVLRTYTTPGGRPVATEENKGTGVGWTWLLADQQNNIRLTHSIEATKRTNYLPNGAPTGNVNLAPGGRGYLNKTHDPSGDIRLDHRNYTPTINILTTPDPLLAPYDPQTLNPYSYSRNNPITLADPTGLAPCRTPNDPMDAGCHHQDPASPGHGTPTSNLAAPADSSAQTSGTIYAPIVESLTASNWLDKISAEQLNQVANVVVSGEPWYWEGLPICAGQGQCSEASDYARKHPEDYEGILTVGLSDCAEACEDAELHRAWGTGLLTALYGVAGARASLPGSRSAGCAPGNSFTGTTLVLMADGSKKPIKDVRLGDKVMATDPETGETGPRKVVDLIRHGGLHTMVAVRLSSGTTIDATDHHPFWVESRGQWVDAIDLQPGDVLVQADGGRSRVLSTLVTEQDLTAYNLTVEGLHTYFAGAEPVLVHNDNDYNQAMRSALSWLEERGFRAERPTLGRFGDTQGKPIGMQSADGKIGYRVEFDERSGAHINVWNGKEKGPHFTFSAASKSVAKIQGLFGCR
ncbi:polymorphic toxin-type HINT domain-containing protein [Nocardioides sp.]|uniref:polymorphic toxin-type HINT domain-containing protein n=1 Tax=Nocardioides sp. TaxID=35761 RepID=UPI002D80B9F9|nr:polymorphic toxin-type HINT domain-containing protein [Nocardioides sp.]